MYYTCNVNCRITVKAGNKDRCMYAAYRWYSYLRCSPFDWNLSSTRYIVTTFLEISRHPKITNLQEKNNNNQQINKHTDKKKQTY